MKFESVGAHLYYYLGAAYYLHHWLLIVGSGGLVTAWFLQSRSGPLVLVLVMSVALIVGGLAAISIRAKKRLDCVNPDLVVNALVDTYQVHGEHKYTFEKRVDVTARHSGVEAYKTKLRWSGSGVVSSTVVCESRQAEIQKVLTDDDTWDIARVQFAKPLLKGERVECVLRFELLDEVGSAKPFFQKLIDDFYPNGLTMRVVLPQHPRQATREIFSSARSEIGLATENIELQTGDHVLAWVVKRPRVGGRYRIRWVM